ncbi:MAG TPA: hypothetical protein VJX67_07165 [Blastocatellia bacterium]|nr:hypothetical protein [Blastocatellia bacterium]
MSSDDLTKQLPDTLTEIKQMFAAIDSRLAALENKVDARLVETRPIWERALAEIAETRHEMAQMRQEISEMRQEMSDMRGEMREGFERTANKVSILSDDSADLRSEMKSVRKRLDRLEGKQ